MDEQKTRAGRNPLKIFISPEWISDSQKQTENNKLINLKFYKYK